MKKHLRDWNWTQFGDVNQKIEKGKDDFLRAENILIQQRTFQHLQAVKAATEHLTSVPLQEEILWKEKSRVKWLMEGDRNTEFFHAVAKSRGIKSKFNLQLEDGSFSNEATVIGPKAMEYYSSLFKAEKCDANSNMLDTITHLINDGMNISVCALPEEKNWKSIELCLQWMLIVLLVQMVLVVILLDTVGIL